MVNDPVGPRRRWFGFFVEDRDLYLIEICVD